MNSQSTYYFSTYSDKRVLVVDYDLRMCEILCTAFRIEGLDATFAVTIPEALSRIVDRHYDVLIVNETVGEDSGVGFLRETAGRKELSGTTFVLTQNAADVERAVDAVKFGVSEVFSKPFDVEKLLLAIKQNIAGRPNQRAAHVTVPGISRLTPREHEVLESITNGQTNKQTGRELGISPRTIEVHRASLMKKLGAKNTADLLRIVLFGHSVSLGYREPPTL
jgi:two-component system response regulator FixJ